MLIGKPPPPPYARRQAKRPRDRVNASAGFAAVDALVALMILSTTIFLTLNAAHTARQTAVAASEMRRAEILLRYLADTIPRAVGSISGRTPTFAWRVDTLPTDAAAHGASFQVCGRTAQAFGALTGRRYRIDTATICPSRAPA